MRSEAVLPVAAMTTHNLSNAKSRTTFWQKQRLPIHFTVMRAVHRNALAQQDSILFCPIKCPRVEKGCDLWQRGKGIHEGKREVKPFHEVYENHMIMIEIMDAKSTHVWEAGRGCDLMRAGALERVNIPKNLMQACHHSAPGHVGKGFPSIFLPKLTGPWSV